MPRSANIGPDDVRLLRSAIRGLPPTSVPKALGISSERFLNWMKGGGRISSEQRTQLAWLGSQNSELTRMAKDAKKAGIKDQKLERQFSAYLREEHEAKGERNKHRSRGITGVLDGGDYDDLFDVIDEGDYDIDPEYYHEAK